MASSDGLRIVVKGKQTHGARPWSGVDPIVVASQIVLGLQTIASRQVDVTLEPSILTIGIIQTAESTTQSAVAGGPNVFLAPKTTGSEDFSAYQKVVPGFFFVGARVKDLPEEKWGANHSPLFQIDESVLKLGVRSLATLTLDYLAAN